MKLALPEAPPQPIFALDRNFAGTNPGRFHKAVANPEACPKLLEIQKFGAAEKRKGASRMRPYVNFK